MRYELEIVAAVPSFPSAEEVVAGVEARGTWRPRVAARAGFDRPEDSPRLLLEADAGARVLVAYERFAYASRLVQRLLHAPEPLRARLTDADLESLRVANAVFRLSVNQAGSYPANAVRFQVQIADALVERFGGVLVDPQMQLVWGAERWRAEGAWGELDLRRHVVIHAEPLPAGLWLHTHGLVKFDRPDLELFDVAESQVEDGALLLQRIARRLCAGTSVAAGDALDVGGFSVRFVRGGDQTPNDYDNACLRVVDDTQQPVSGAPEALRRLHSAIG